MVPREGVEDLEALKRKVVAPSLLAAFKAQRQAEEYKVEEQGRASKQLSEEMDVRSRVSEHKKAKAKAQANSQGEGDRAGVKVSPCIGRRMTQDP